jgi:hypothetical protein
MTKRIFQTLPTQTDTSTVAFPGLTENDLLWVGVCPGRPALPYPCPALFVVTDRQIDTTFAFIYKMEEGEYSWISSSFLHSWVNQHPPALRWMLVHPSPFLSSSSSCCQHYLKCSLVIIKFSKPNWVWTLDHCQAVTQKQKTDPAPTIIREIFNIIHNHGSQKNERPDFDK